MPFRSARVLTHAEANTRPSERRQTMSTMDELGTRRTTERVRDSETLGLRCHGLTSWRGWEGPAEFTLNGGMNEETHSGTWEAPEIVSHSNARTYAEYPHRESICSEVADVAVVLGGGERPLHGKGRHGRTQPVQETSAGHAGSEHRSQSHCGE